MPSTRSKNSQTKELPSLIAEQGERHLALNALIAELPPAWTACSQVEAPSLALCDGGRVASIRGLAAPCEN